MIKILLVLLATALACCSAAAPDDLKFRTYYLDVRCEDVMRLSPNGSIAALPGRSSFGCDIWVTNLELESKVRISIGCGASTTHYNQPAVSDDALFQPGFAFTAYNIANGSKMWDVPTMKWTGPPAYCDHAKAVFVVSGSQLVKLDAQTGSVLWTSAQDVSVQKERPFVANSGAVVLVSDVQNRLVGLDAQTGAQKFAIDSMPVWYTLNGMQAVNDGTSVALLLDKDNYAIVKVNVNNGNIAWRTDLASPTNTITSGSSQTEFIAQSSFHYWLLNGSDVMAVMAQSGAPFRTGIALRNPNDSVGGVFAISNDYIVATNSLTPAVNIFNEQDSSYLDTVTAPDLKGKDGTGGGAGGANSVVQLTGGYVTVLSKEGATGVPVTPIPTPVPTTANKLPTAAPPRPITAGPTPAPAPVTTAAPPGTTMAPTQIPATTTAAPQGTTMAPTVTTVSPTPVTPTSPPTMVPTDIPTGNIPTGNIPTNVPSGAPPPPAPGPTGAPTAAPTWNFTNGGVLVTVPKEMTFSDLRDGLRRVLCAGSWSCLPGYYTSPDRDLYLALGQPSTFKSTVFLIKTNQTWIMHELIGLPQRAFVDRSYYFDNNLPVGIKPAVAISDLKTRGQNHVVVQVVNEDSSSYMPWDTMQSQLWSNLDLSSLTQNGTSLNLTLVNSTAIWNATWKKYVQNFTISCDYVETQIQIQGMNWTSLWNLPYSSNVFGSQDAYMAWFPPYVPLDSTGVPMAAKYWGQRIQFNATSYRKGDWQDFDYVRGRFYSTSQYWTNKALRIKDEYSIKLVKSWAVRNSTALAQMFTVSLSKSSIDTRYYLESMITLGKVSFSWLDNPKAKLVAGGGAAPEDGGDEKKSSNTGVIVAVVVVLVVGAIVGVVLVMRNRAARSTGAKNEDMDYQLNTGGRV